MFSAAETKTPEIETRNADFLRKGKRKFSIKKTHLKKPKKENTNFRSENRITKIDKKV